MTPNTSPRWGVFGTSVWILVLAVVIVTVEICAAIFVIQDTNPDLTIIQATRLIDQKYPVGSIADMILLTSTAVAIPVLIGIIKLKRGSTVTDYLALHSVTLNTAVTWTAVGVAPGVLASVLGWVHEIPPPDIIVIPYKSMGNPWLFFFVGIIVTPLIEEVIFRGFVISGFEGSFLGKSGAVILSAALWAATHEQYELVGMVWLLPLGFILGISRIVTRSIFPAVLIHMAHNTAAYVNIAARAE